MLLPAVSAVEIEFGVSPGNLNFALSPGDSAEVFLSVLNRGASTEEYLIFLDNEVYAGWFEITPSNFELQPGQEKQVTVKLSVPSSVREDADCKIELLQISDTNVMTGIRVPVHIEAVNANESFSGGNKSENENVTGEVPGFTLSFAGAVFAVAAFLVKRRIFE